MVEAILTKEVEVTSSKVAKSKVDKDLPFLLPLGLQRTKELLQSPKAQVAPSVEGSTRKSV